MGAAIEAGEGVVFANMQENTHNLAGDEDERNIFQVETANYIKIKDVGKSFCGSAAEGKTK